MIPLQSAHEAWVVELLGDRATPRRFAGETLLGRSIDDLARERAVRVEHIPAAQAAARVAEGYELYTYTFAVNNAPSQRDDPPLSLNMYVDVGRRIVSGISFQFPYSSWEKPIAMRALDDRFGLVGKRTLKTDSEHVQLLVYDSAHDPRARIADLQMTFPSFIVTVRIDDETPIGLFARDSTVE